MFAVISRSETESGFGGSGAARSFARAQKSFGVIDLVFNGRTGISEPRRVFQEGAMKVRFPALDVAAPPEAVLINLAGGLTGGDRLEFGIALEEKSSAVITTQACERIYRSSGEDAVVTGQIRLEPATCMEWLPQATILFNGGRLTRETHVSLATNATLLAVECIIFGRTARGESMVSGALCDSWFIRREGELIHAETFALDGDIQATLDRPSVLNGHRAMATLRYVAPNAAERIGDIRGILDDAPHGHGTVSAASAWNGLMIVRMTASDGFHLMREIARVLTGFRNKPLPRLWSL